VNVNVSPSFQLWICLEIRSYFLRFSHLIHSAIHPVIQQSDHAKCLLTTLGSLWDADILICRSSQQEPAHFNYVIKIPYVLSSTHTYCRQSALIKQASDQRHLYGERLTGFRTKDVQGSYYICQLWLISKKNIIKLTIPTTKNWVMTETPCYGERNYIRLNGGELTVLR
jgi:hypothetical protein